jgi:hypothetical protein
VRIGRYELLNTLESVQMHADKEAKAAADKAKKKKKKKKQELEEEEADRAQLWQALLSTDSLTRGKLENLYWEEVCCFFSVLSGISSSLALSVFLIVPLPH